MLYSQLFNTIDLSTLPKPTYWMSDEIINIHMNKHHQGYINKLKPLIENTPLESLPLDQIILTSYNNMTNHKGDDLQNTTNIFNNAAQIWNHNVFWLSMKQNSTPTQKIKDKITSQYQSLENFYKEFINHGIKQFGSGWLWLILKDDSIKMYTTSNAHTPITSKHQVLLTCDLWEHSYYLKYTFNRKQYLEDFTQYINWDLIENQMKKYI